MFLIPGVFMFAGATMDASMVSQTNVGDVGIVVAACQSAIPRNAHSMQTFLVVARVGKVKCITSNCLIDVA